MTTHTTNSTRDHNITLVSRLAGAVWGHLVGDATGVPYEFSGPHEPATVRFGATGTWGMPAGTWSDDGALMLALLDSLLTMGFDPEDQGRRALAWRDDAAYTPDLEGRFDIGTTTSDALDRFASGMTAVDAGPTDERACGNGSLMRILPVALIGRGRSAAELIAQTHEASRVTHGHPRCQVACALYCLAVRQLLRGETPDEALDWAFTKTAKTYGADPGSVAHLAALEEIRAWTARSGRGFVIDSFWSAWDAFAGAADYADTIRRAIAYGNDTDTTAAIAGGLAGARWGWDAIPLEWRRGMRGRDVAGPLVDRLAEGVGARTSRVSPLRVNLMPLDETALAETGRLGITFLPGKKHDGYTGLHWRDLDTDLARLRSLGVDTLFLLVEDAELEFTRVSELPEVMALEDLELVRFPIRDPRTPTDGIGFRTAVLDLMDRVRAGEFVAVACRGGMDRSGMTVACIYRELGLDADTAIARVQANRSHTITLRDQQAFVRAWPPTA
jgi:ADP-ribosylglycohydrolase